MAKKTKTEERGLPSLALVFGYLAVKDLQRLADQIPVLARLGYGNQEIATICDTTPNTVNYFKSTLKRKKRGRRT